MSNGSNTKLKIFARRLLAFEAASSKPSDAGNSAAFHVCEKIRDPLGKVMGQGGFRSLLVRALAMAGAEVSWLSALRIKPDGSVEGLDQLEGEFTAWVFTEGEVALVGQLLALLVTFIGAELTLRLLREIWPKMENLKF